MVVPIAPTADLRAALDALAGHVESVPFNVPSPERADRRHHRDRVVWSIREYLLPRLGDIDGPARVVVVGSTGSGKSTLVNSIAGYRVTEPGALRPTTRHPVLWCHQRFEAEYAFNFLTGYGTSADAEQPMRIVAGTDPLLEGVSILDAPDFDSVEEAHHEIADQLLAVADVCIFVTSAQRYADAVPWEFLAKAKNRGIPVVHVMNRMPEGGSAAASDYRDQLRSRSIPVNLFLTVAEQPIDPVHAGLPAAAVSRLVERLRVLSDHDVRRHLMIETTQASTTDILERVDGLIRDVHGERASVEALVAAAESAYTAQAQEIADEIERASLIRGHVIERWQDFLGTGDMMKGVVEGASKVKDWLGKVLGGPSPSERVEVEVRGELETIVSRRAGRAAAATSTAWELDPVGASLLAGTGYQLWREDEQTPGRAKASVDDWMAELARMVEDEGGDKRRVAQLASAGVNVVAVTATVGVFMHTGGVTGTEIGVAAGAAAVQQKILEHVFGSAAARSLIADGQRALVAALGGVLDADRRRFDEAVGDVAPPPGIEDEIMDAAGRVIDLGLAFYAT